MYPKEVGIISSRDVDAAMRHDRDKDVFVARVINSVIKPGKADYSVTNDHNRMLLKQTGLRLVADCLLSFVRPSLLVPGLLGW